MVQSPFRMLIAGLALGAVVLGQQPPVRAQSQTMVRSPEGGAFHSTRAATKRTLGSEDRGLRGSSPVLANPILFVTQVPQPADFATIGSVFANHLASLHSAPRGGDLWIRYDDGTLCNLTEAAGYGSTGFQGENAIAVRDPAVHWDGSRAVFSMVIGAASERFEVNDYFWQLYEVTGFESCSSINIQLVPNQPTGVNNTSPVYASDDRILFVSDRSRSGEAHLYPQLDEYESTPTPTGLWSLNPSSGELFLMNHAPSGAFDPTVDSFGRVIFTRWDHLQRDQQSDADPDGTVYGTFDYASEAANASRSSNRLEVFPESRFAEFPFTGHRLNSFFPWQINQDGTAEEFVNHVGRHELQSYFDRARSDDSQLVEFIDAVVTRANPNSIENFLQIREDPAVAGRFLGTDAPEFETHAAGQIIAMVATPTANPDDLVVQYVTHPDTGTVVPAGSAPVTHSGQYRDPLPMSDGALIAAHADTTDGAENLGTGANPNPRFDFRLRLLEPGTGASVGYLVAGNELTGGISKSITWWSPDIQVTYSGELWELNPVEVIARSVPAAPTSELSEQELARFNQADVDVEVLRDWMVERELGLITVRDTTARDDADLQQPFNLRVPGGRETSTGSGTVYDITAMQLLQGDQVRGYGGVDTPDDGRRVLARFLHDTPAIAANTLVPSPQSSVAIAADGSVAAFVPARRALAWQTVDPTGQPVVRERYWITLQPGEIRSCDGCHGVNIDNQVGGAASDQEPQALLDLLQEWQSLFTDGFESGTTTLWSSTTP